MYQIVPAALGTSVLGAEVVAGQSVLAATGVAAGAYLTLAAGLILTGTVLRFIARHRTQAV